ncbi:unnamed protein product [Cuscuta campestris]|uniref:Retrotransposon Copia-like N-terminal domain-containing protein n=1 Tax=Cuscuta campestris TaxID=132261 RepID=A0A484KG04_9ASTE|nr:unnamed protein product [Cuscuta campestris]
MAENSEITSQNNSSKPPHLAFTTISNAKLHVPVQLSLSQPNYKKWSRLFLLLVRRFNLKGYIDGSVVPLSDDDDKWFQLDALLQGWILSTITDEVSDLVISSVSTASALLKVIHDLFHDNKHARAMQLEHEFHTTVKGNSTMAAYCQQLQNLSDWLDDVDAPVSQHQLVLQILRGLPADLQGQTSFMQFQDPMPTFLQAMGKALTAVLPMAMADSMEAQAMGKATPGNVEAMDEDKVVTVEIGVEVADVKTAHDHGNPTTATIPGTHRTLTRYADIFTKGLPSLLFLEFKSSLGIRPPPHPT